MITVTDILENPPETDKYNKFKETLITRFTRKRNKWERYYQVLSLATKNYPNCYVKWKLSQDRTLVVKLYIYEIWMGKPERGWGAGGKTEREGYCGAGGGQSMSELRSPSTTSRSFLPRLPSPRAHVCELVTSRRDAKWRQSYELEGRRATERVRAFFSRVRCLAPTPLAPTPFAFARTHSHRRCVLEDLTSHDGSALTRTYVAYFFRDDTLLRSILPLFSHTLLLSRFFYCQFNKKDIK